MMRRKDSLRQQANALYKKVKELEAVEQRKIGKVVMDLYEKGELKDASLSAEIAKIIGDEESDKNNDDSMDIDLASPA